MEDEELLERILRIIDYDASKAPIAIFPTGSHAYGVNDPQDRDFIVITQKIEDSKRIWKNVTDLQVSGWFPERNVFQLCEYQLVEQENLDVFVFPLSTWTMLCSEYVPFAVEAIFLNKPCTKEMHLDFKSELLNNILPLNKTKLYHSFSEVAIQHWNIAINGLSVFLQGHFKYNNKPAHSKVHLRTALKKAYHSIRMLQFAIQIVKVGNISSFEETNALRERILSYTPRKSWTVFESEFLPILNSHLDTLHNLCQPNNESNNNNNHLETFPTYKVESKVVVKVKKSSKKRKATSAKESNSDPEQHFSGQLFNMAVPKEILQQIFSDMHYFDLMNCMLVNKWWHSICSDMDFLKRMCLRRWNHKPYLSVRTPSMYLEAIRIFSIYDELGDPEELCECPQCHQMSFVQKNIKEKEDKIIHYYQLLKEKDRTPKGILYQTKCSLAIFRCGCYVYDRYHCSVCPMVWGQVSRRDIQRFIMKHSVGPTKDGTKHIFYANTLDKWFTVDLQGRIRAYLER